MFSKFRELDNILLKRPNVNPEYTLDSASNAVSNGELSLNGIPDSTPESNSRSQSLGSLQTPATSSESSASSPRSMISGEDMTWRASPYKSVSVNLGLKKCNFINSTLSF